MDISSAIEPLIKEISARTGISEDQARQAVPMVINFIKQQLPEPLASQVDGFLGGGAGGNNDMGDQAMDMLGGMFGGKKD